MTALHGHVQIDSSDPVPDAQALSNMLGIESLQYSARLACVCGIVLVALTAWVAWRGVAAINLDVIWLAWAALPALIAALGGPLLARQLLSRRNLLRWRLVMLSVMSVSSTAWAWAVGVAAGAEDLSFGLFVVAWVALSLSVLPSLHWLAGLCIQLVAQLLVTIGASQFVNAQADALLLPLGLWMSLLLVGLAAALYARRAERVRADNHFMRVETAELQRQLGDDEARLREAEGRRQTLEAELAEILDLAEDASRTKTEFLATMSHEIRTPLNGILPILEMLRDTRLNEEQLKLVRTAQNSSRHLLRIINDILDFSKVESGKLQLETIEIDVRELVKSVTELMSGSARNHNLKLSTKVTDNVPQVVRGDPIRLRQILINLVSNAIKFTEEGGIRVEVSRGQTSQKEVELLFAVADTGLGMLPETADRLFQSFTQADASTTRKHGGTGLGLVICKRLVELMGGKIGVRSALGQGSTFWFLVPLRKSVMEVPSARRDLKGVRVLTLIGDAETARKVGFNLRRWGVVEEATADPSDALSKMRSVSMLGESWTYELALIDGSGLEQRLPSLLAEIRSIETLKRMNILIAVRSETLAHKLKRDFSVLVLADGLRPEPMRRILHRLFDVESSHFGSTEMRAEEVYDDLNVPADDIGLDELSTVTDAGEFSGQVLLVEDNPVNLGVVKKALSKLGLRCETAIDGKEALALFDRQRFDIIFMDCQMPVMDGYEATRRIRRLESADGRVPTPIVAMTANAMEGDREKCMKVGMDDYLPKPVNLSELRSRVASWLEVVDRLQRERPPGDAARKLPPTRSTPLLDEKVLSELREIMDEDYLALLRTFLRNAPELIDEISSAIERRDVDGMVIPVHSLKSSSANVGAMRLSELARGAEKSARSGDLMAAEAAFAALESAFGEAAEALRQHMTENNAA